MDNVFKKLLMDIIALLYLDLRINTRIYCEKRKGSVKRSRKNHL